MDASLPSARHRPISSREVLLLTLRRHGPLSPDAVAARIGMSRTSALQALRGLAEEGLVERRSIRHGVGRPRHLYDLTAGAQDALPAGYDGLATSLLQAVATVGGVELIERVFEERCRIQVAALRSALEQRGLADAPLADRVREIAKIQDEQGYVSDLAEAGSVDDGSISLREHNCPIWRVAAAVPAACEAEERMFSEVLDADVVRQSHMLRGERCCTYKVVAAAAGNGN